MNVIDITKARQKRDWISALKEGPLLLSTQHAVSPRYVEEGEKFFKYLKQRMANELAQFLVDNGFINFYQRSDYGEEYKQFQMDLVILVGHKTVKRVLESEETK